MTPNYKSATCNENRSAVEAQIRYEIENGRYLIVQKTPKIISALGAIVKPNGKIRLIHDCSRPQGNSLNDFWDKETFSYACIQDAVDNIERGHYLAKVDLASAFRSVRTNITNHTFCGLQWTFAGDTQPTMMVDKRLPFGARRSPYVFNALTQAVTRHMHTLGFTNTVCYLDDFLCIESDRTRCNEALVTLIKVLRQVGFSINYSKVEGPSQSLSFLGIVLDTRTLTLNLSAEKVKELKTILESYATRKKITRREIQRLAGKLQFATQCIYGGKFFLRRIHNAAMNLKRPWHRVRVTSEMLKDVRWWANYLETFNGCVDMVDPRPMEPMFTDACNVAGAAVMGDEFVYARWEHWAQTSQLHINYKEALAFELGLTKWADKLQNRKVIVYSDNVTAVSLLNKCSTKDKTVMESLRRIFWLSARFNFRLTCRYYRGCDNRIADGVSRLHEGARLWKNLPVFPVLNSDEVVVSQDPMCMAAPKRELATSGDWMTRLNSTPPWHMLSQPNEHTEDARDRTSHSALASGTRPSLPHQRRYADIRRIWLTGYLSPSIPLSK